MAACFRRCSVPGRGLGSDFSTRPLDAPHAVHRRPPGPDQPEPDHRHRHQGARAEGGRAGRHQPVRRRARFRHAAIHQGRRHRRHPGAARPNTPTSPARRRCAGRWRRSSAATSGIDYAADEIIVSTGGKQVIFNAMLATLNAGRRGDHPDALLGQLPRHRRARRRQAGVRAVRPEQRLQAARRGPGSGHHAAHQVADPQQPLQPDRRRLFRRRAAADLRRAAAASGCVGLHRRHLREARL